MDDGSRLSMVIVILLLFGAMYFALVETAFASVSRNKLKTDADRGDVRAKKALAITDNFERAITTILICTNILHLAAASLVTVTVTRIWGINAVAVSTIITTIVVFFAGEMLPKSIARKYSEQISLVTAGSLRFFMLIFTPISACLSAIGNLAVKVGNDEPETTVTEDELYDIIEDMTEEGSLDEEQGELISSAIQFGDVTVESILTSRVDLSAIDISMSVNEMLEYVKQQKHSRFPVYDGTVDHIVGVLQIRKFLRAYLQEGESLNVESLLDEPFFVHQSAKIDDILPMLSTQKQNVAIVSDNYGGTLGIVTIEDILEELVGEIWDEDDTAEESIEQIEEGCYIVDSGETVGDVFDALGLEYDEEEDDELINKLMGELAYEQFSTIPEQGDCFVYRNLEFTVLSMDYNRILKLKVRVIPEEVSEDGGEQE